VAPTATLYNFEIDLSDADRHRYETLALRMARHPSESEEHLAARLLAYCLEYADGIVFSSGLSDPDEPAVSVRDLTGAMRVGGRHRLTRCIPPPPREQVGRPGRRVYTQRPHTMVAARVG
jgi:hypothetical protein